MFRSCDWATLVLVVLAPPCASSQQVHAFNVEDDIAMVRFSDPRPQPGVSASQDAELSPDGKYVTVVTTKGILSTDQVESQLRLFVVRDVREAVENGSSPLPRSRIIASVVSYPHREQTAPYASLIKDLRWSPDGKTLYFRRENLQGFSQICAVELQPFRLRVLTSSRENVNLFDVSADTVVYTESQPDPESSANAHRINADARVATGQPIFEILFPNDRIQGAAETWSLKVLQNRNHHWTVRKVPGFKLRDRPLLSDLIPFRLSPDRKSVVTLLPVPKIPSDWEQYAPATGAEHLRFRGGDVDVMDPRNGDRPQQYIRIDLTTGKQTALIEAPDGWSLGYTQPRQIIWSPDGRRILVTNTFLPIETGTQKDADIHRACGVASVELSENEYHCVFFAKSSEAPNSIRSVTFGRNNGEVIVIRKTSPDQQERCTYKLVGRQWQLLSSTSEDLNDSEHSVRHANHMNAASTLRVFVRQTLNDPPTLWVEETNSGKQRQIWDPNPQFKVVRFAPAIAYDWKDETGTEWKGQLVKPLDYVPGRRYPLVVQLYAIDKDQFITGGPYPTAFAARELASVGFFVLLVQKRRDTLTEQDPIIHLRAYRSGVEKLVAEGLVDRTRVGVIGFSWSCWYAADVLVRDPDLFAAATIADGLDNSYMQYHFAADVQPIQRQMEHIRGAGPFGNGLKSWLADSPGFHLDRVRAPVRIEAINPASVLQEWELYSSLRMQNKPVDLIYFPSGTHIHQKPLERLESQQGDVDWFRFWLQGYEDPAASKRKQYDRWEELRSHMHER